MAKNITKAKHRFPLRQIRQIPKVLRRTWPIYTLIVLTLFIAFLNYEPGTILLGWDNLSSELNPMLNLQRALFSVWQEYQSLGLLGGMAHAADLPRLLLIHLFSLIPNFPISSIRYLLVFLPLVLGPLGVYLFLDHRLFKNLLDSRTTQYASFLGGLFYLLNLSTMQTFFTPFESFTYFYGAFPWLLYFLTGYLEKPGWTSLLAIFIVSLISAPTFYVETIFVVFLLLLIPIFFEVFYSPKNKKISFKKIFRSFFAVFIPQLFWFFPIIFFVLTNGHVGEQAKINLLSSSETFYRNLQFGNLFDIALLKGFFFNFLDLSGLGKFDYLLSVWRGHLAAPLVSLLGYLIFGVVVTGIYYSLTKKFFWTKSLLGIFLICVFFLLGGGLLINSAIPLVGELFRSPFTKFSIPLAFTYACFFSIGTVFLLDLFTYLHSRLTYPLTLFTVTASLFIFMSPVFSGNLINTNMRLSLPREYTDLFNYLKTQDPSTRIANFPQYTFWGWNYYDWGYRGSGFLWYGIKQPILDRAFDVWEKSSEKYYEEISTALYSGRQTEFENILDKYAVSWVLLDKHQITPNPKIDTKNITLEKFLTNSEKFTLTKSFNDQIFLYRVALKTKPQNFLSISVPLAPGTNNPAPITPFSSLTLRPNTDWVEKNGYLSTAVPLAPSTNNPAPSTLHLPSLTDTETLLPVRVEYQRQFGTLTLRLTPLVPTLFTNSQQIDLTVKPSFIQIPVSSANSFILQIDHQFFSLQIPAEIPDLSTFILLTTTYLPAETSFEINLFDAFAASSSNLTDRFRDPSPTPCYYEPKNLSAGRRIEKIITGSSLSLVGTDVVGCLSTPLPYVPGGTLMSLSFTYFSPTLTPGNVNVSGKDFNAGETPQPLNPHATPRRVQVFATSTGLYQQANLILEASDTRSVQEITYHDITLSTHSLLFSARSRLASIPGQEITLTGQERFLQISLPITDTAYDIRQLPESNGLFPENRNCDQFNNGKTNKLVSKDGFLYQSKNAIECDYLNLRHLPHSLNYLLSFQVEAQKGLPLTVCLENQSTFRCDVHERLANTTLSQSIIQPIANPDESAGYTLHLFNQSVGGRVTSNLLKELSLRPIPLSFMKSISISPPITNNQEPITNNSPFSSTHPAEFLYVLSLSPSQPITNNPAPSTNTLAPRTINLYQTKSPYWQALQVPSADLQLPSWLLITKIIFDYPRLTQLLHADTDLWHNSWSLQNCNLSSENCHLIIIYLPQYLQFFGFLFLLTPVLVFLLHKLFPKIKP